jgi:hypothetical protein
MKNFFKGLVAFGLVMMGGLLAFAAYCLLRGQSPSEPWNEVRSNIDLPSLHFPSNFKFSRMSDK